MMHEVPLLRIVTVVYDPADDSLRIEADPPMTTFEVFGLLTVASQLVTEDLDDYKYPVVADFDDST